MKRHAFLFLLLMFIPLTGCISQIDESIAKVDEDQHKAWLLTKVVIDNGIVGYGETEDGRNTLQKSEVDRRLKDALDKVTGPDGRLYSPTTTAADGHKVGVTREDIEKLIKDRDTLLVQAELSHRKNMLAISLMKDAVNKYDAALSTLTDKKADWLEKRKSAAAAINAAVTALSSAGGVAAIAALAF